MTESVHILASVRNPALLDATRLVFRTLPTAFPKARVEVYGNALEWFARKEIEGLCRARGAEFVNGRYRPHDAWVENLILTMGRPFWICDTDVVFFSEVQSPKSKVQSPESCCLAGRLEPEFLEEWTGTVHVERLHTALMWFDPVPLRCKMREWMCRVPPPWGSTAQMNLVRQTFLPARANAENAENAQTGNSQLTTHNSTLFYDTCAGLWQAGIGTPFTEQENEGFEHLHCGTYADAIAQGTESLKDLQRVHQGIYDDPQKARGLRAKQQEYYRSRATHRAALTGARIINGKDGKKGKDGKEFDRTCETANSQSYAI